MQDESTKTELETTKVKVRTMTLKIYLGDGEDTVTSETVNGRMTIPEANAWIAEKHGEDAVLLQKINNVTEIEVPTDKLMELAI